MKRLIFTENEKSEAKENGLILAGKTGSGKTTLLNTIFGKNISKVEKSSKSGTQESSIYYYKLDNGKNISIIDTPGLSDTNKINNIEIESTHLKGIIKLIINEKISIKGILFLLNFQNERIDSDEERVFLVFNKLFPSKIFWKNIVIIFTHYYTDPNGDTKEEIKNAREETNYNIFETIIKCTRTFSEIINCKDLCIKYYNSYFPTKNEKQEKNNLKIKNDLELLLYEFYKKEPLFTKNEFLELNKDLKNDFLSEKDDINNNNEKGEVIIEDTFQKKSPWLHYNKRIVKFYSKGLIDYINPYNNELRGSIKINSYCFANVINDYKFEIVTISRTFVFKHKSNKVAHKWVEEINSFVDKYNEKNEK